MTSNSRPHTVVMTGASRGIGWAAAESILRLDPTARLVTIGRGPGPSHSRATHVRADLRSVAQTAAAVDSIARRIVAKELPPLDVVVGNAGVQCATNCSETEDGYETTFAVAVVANHLVVRGFADALDRPARVVITVSDTHFGDVRHNLGMVPGPRWVPPDRLARVRAFADPESVRAGRTAYSTNKLAAIHLVHALARVLPAGVDVVSFNPGFVPGTGLARDAGFVSRSAMVWLLPVLAVTPIASTAAQAGRALADVALGVIATRSGDYVDRRTVTRSSDESYDRQREDELWAFLNDGRVRGYGRKNAEIRP
ncbi:SDR family NAD(P)-dependent oxidoreductase [Rhodococcoides fascians]|uniref:SDR family NAD(P)-dependent oxidoreductase n=1 Tax=Rhodococcoides fascians TaxID=1828 RepID=UPI000A8505E3|nr:MULTISPECIES: SDR family NAD(P)-dependent oxidoreductase [Rhodococcus]